uniref:Glycosyltransferase 2-like domain-containing protein n=1 Tax=viral metagenome TaxID=1070528 RepID=A0A6C0ESY0_9ZZZZ
MKYPIIIFFRYEKYSDIDSIFKDNSDKLLCSINFIFDKNDINKLYDSNNHLLITYGPNSEEYCYDVNSIIVERMRNRWIHCNNLANIDDFNSCVNKFYMNNIVKPPETTRPVFSIFTTCYNSYDKILRAYNSLISQKLKDWEWVILDDSPDDLHFTFLKEKLSNNKKIRLYKRSENSGSIGNVKNEAVSLCRGKYVLELDHDDEIPNYVLSDSEEVFNRNDDVGFIYMEFANIYENGENFNYGNLFGLGYSGYYREKYNDKWLYVAVNPNINNATLSHIVSVPNHPRIWRKKTLLEIGNYNEFLPISDDYELLLRTVVNTKMVKIPKLGYIQYMNDNSNNFSLIRNSEINRLRHHLTINCYDNYKINDFLKKNNAYESDVNIKNHISIDIMPIWKKTDYKYKYCNTIINLNHKKQYCIIGLEALYKFLSEIKLLYQDDNNDFILLDNKFSSEHSNVLCNLLDSLQFDKMKCYSMEDCSYEQLINYFHLIYKSCNDFCIVTLDKGFDSKKVNNIEIDISVKSTEDETQSNNNIEEYNFNNIDFDMNNVNNDTSNDSSNVNNDEYKCSTLYEDYIDLDELSKKYKLDKNIASGCHNYIPAYVSIFQGIRYNIKNILEIGIGSVENGEMGGVVSYGYKTGNGLKCWSEYFPNSHVFGLGIYEHKELNTDKITTFVADQSNVNDLQKVINNINSKLDIIIDDGTHNGEDQVTSFMFLNKFLTKNGIYIIEDIQDKNINKFIDLTIFSDEDKKYIIENFTIKYFDMRSTINRTDDFIICFKKK